MKEKMGKNEVGSSEEVMDTDRSWADSVLSRKTWKRWMFLKGTKCIQWDTEKETKQTDDKAEQVVNGLVDPWLKLSLGGGAKESKGMSLQLHQLPSMKKETWVEDAQSALFFSSLFSSVCVSFEILLVSSYLYWVVFRVWTLAMSIM